MFSVIAISVSATLFPPFFLVIARHNIRLARLRALFEFDELFGVSRIGEVQTGAPTYEYVRARYTDDIEFPEKFPQEWIKRFDMGQEEFRRFVRRLRWWSVKSSWAILLAFVPLVVVSGVGLYLTLLPAYEPRLATCGNIQFVSVCPTNLWLQGTSATLAGALVSNVNTVCEVAFLGGYLFTILLFLRSLATFDLSPLTVLRGTAYLVVGVFAALILYRAFPNPEVLVLAPVEAVQHFVSQTSNPADAPAGSQAAQAKGNTVATRPLGVWFIFAFVIGFMPDAGINAISDLLQRFVFAIKSEDTKMKRISKSTPLDIIDGIDPFTRFRLQEANIFDVQNLATANPVMLFVESPYGIYEIVDWIAQAQLCIAVGAERFFCLRRQAVRTVFDLERIMLSSGTTDQLRTIVGSLIAAPVDSTSANSPVVLSPLGLAVMRGGESVAPRNRDDAAAFTASLLSQRATRQGTPAPDPDASLRHLTRVIVDDLHVCRLRQVWLQILGKIDGVDRGPLNAEYLPDTERPQV